MTTITIEVGTSKTLSTLKTILSIFSDITIVKERDTETPNKDTLQAIEECRKGIGLEQLDISSPENFIKAVQAL